MPYKDPVKRRMTVRDSTRRWREMHPCLNTTEIEERLRELGGAGQAISHIETVSLEDPRIEPLLRRKAYQDWLQEAL